MSLVVEGGQMLLTVEGHWQRVQMGLFCWLLQFCHMSGSLQIERHKLGFCRLVLVSQRVEDLCLGKKKVPWQLAAQIEDHKRTCSSFLHDR